MSRGAERGCATVWVTLACLLLGVGAAGGAAGGGVLVAHRQAAAAADLAALAGATVLRRGGDGCARAAAVASANEARVETCLASHGELRVVVSRTVRLLGRRLEVRARARAGPSPPPAAVRDPRPRAPRAHRAV